MTTDDWVIIYAFDLDPTDATLEQWADDLESIDASVARIPGLGVDVTTYADGQLPMLAAADRLAGTVTRMIHAEPVGVSILRESAHEVRAESPTMPELMSAAEIAEELGVARQRVHQLRAMASFPAPLAELRGGAVWDAAAVRKFNTGWARKPGRPRMAQAT